MHPDVIRLAAVANAPLNPERVSPIETATLSLPDLLRLDIPERRRLLPWLPEGGSVMIFGPRGIGKTYFTLTLAVSLASPSPFLRWNVPHACGVLLVDGEMALHDLRERLTLLVAGPLEAPLYVLSHEVFYQRSERDLNLGAEDLREGLKIHLDTHPDIRVVILDNLSCLLPGVREDKRDDWTANALPLLLWLRRRSVAVVLVHHAGKAGDQRGTSSREDTLDTIIKLERIPDAPANEGAQFLVRFAKSRGAFGDEVSDLEARLETDPSGAFAWTWKPVEFSNEQRLLQLVEEGVETVSDAAEMMGLTRGAVSKIKAKLQKAGRLGPGKELSLGPRRDPQDTTR